MNNHYYFIKKITLSRPKTFYKKINWYLINTVFRGPVYHHSKFVTHICDTVEKEFLTWKLWKNENIPTLDFYAKDSANGIIVWKFQPNSQSFKTLLSQTDKYYYEFKLLVKTFKTMRECAKLKCNPNLLHSDPLLANFLYEKTQNRVIPIDAEIVLNSKMTLNQLNISLLNYFLGSLLCLEKPDWLVREYVRIFVKSLDHSEAKGLYRFNNERSLLNKFYFYLRNSIRKKLKKKEENQFIRGTELALSRRYDFCAKQVLLERLGNFGQDEYLKGGT